MNRDISEGGGPDGPRGRKIARTSLAAEVLLRRSGHHHYMVNVYDISPSGCRIEFVERPRLDETVWVKFEGLDAIESTVCWLKGSDAGVEFARPIYQPVFEALVSRLTTEHRSPFGTARLRSGTGPNENLFFVTRAWFIPLGVGHVGGPGRTGLIPGRFDNLAGHSN